MVSAPRFVVGSAAISNSDSGFAPFGASAFFIPLLCWISRANFLNLPNGLQWRFPVTDNSGKFGRKERKTSPRCPLMMRKTPLK
jgi:hypothetical protein